MKSTGFYEPAFVGCLKGGPTHEAKGLNIRSDEEQTQLAAVAVQVYLCDNSQ